MIVENKSNACQALKLFLACMCVCVCGLMDPGSGD